MNNSLLLRLKMGIQMWYGVQVKMVHLGSMIFGKAFCVPLLQIKTVEISL
jgi:hypothetical protein